MKPLSKLQFDQFELLVMPHGLISAPSSYQRLVNFILKTHANEIELKLFTKMPEITGCYLWALPALPC
jgi:hypothetical protein